MSQLYEERLQRDLNKIRTSVAEVSEKVEHALRQAIKALLTRDRQLANETILGDLPINRAIRHIDRLCHFFVARHLPSAGHLRFVSAVLRMNIAIERLGANDIWCKIMAGNESSVGVATNAGLNRDRVVAATPASTGCQRDVLIYRLKSEDYFESDY